MFVCVVVGIVYVCMRKRETGRERENVLFSIRVIAATLIETITMDSLLLLWMPILLILSLLLLKCDLDINMNTSTYS